MFVDEKVFVIGSSTPLTAAILQFRKNAIFFGRSNPHDLPHWVKIPGQDTKKGITRAIESLESTVSFSSSPNETHLICLQGLSDTDWESSINVNLLSPALIAERFCTLLTAADAIGSITLIASASSYLGGKATYASTKAALFGLMNSLQSKHLTTRVNIVLPGAFEGGMTADWDSEKRHTIGKQANAKRLATANEIAHAINFCMENKFLSQSIINMTSGRVAIA